MKLAFAFLYLIHFLPHSAIRFLARILGGLCYYLVLPRRKVGLINLRLCFPEYTEQQRQAILKKHFYHMALLILEYGENWYGKPETLYAKVRYHNKHYLDEQLERGEKVILLYPHFTAFEAAVYALNQDVPLISVYSHQKNKQLDEQILKGRHRFQNVFLIGRTEGLRSIIRKIKESSAPFLYLPDQDFGAKESVFVPFFGVPTATIAGLSRIAKMTGAKVVPLIPYRDGTGKVDLYFYPAWDNYPTEHLLADVERMNQMIEERVRACPEQYFWLHKRFKTRPEGEASFYE